MINIYIKTLAIYFSRTCVLLKIDLFRRLEYIFCWKKRIHSLFGEQYKCLTYVKYGFARSSLSYKGNVLKCNFTIETVC